LFLALVVVSPVAQATKPFRKNIRLREGDRVQLRLGPKTLNVRCGPRKQLTLEDPKTPGRTVPLNRSMILGRQNPLGLSSLRSGRVSRTHVGLSVDTSGKHVLLRIQDLGSRNGTQADVHRAPRPKRPKRPSAAPPQPARRGRGLLGRLFFWRGSAQQAAQPAPQRYRRPLITGRAQSKEQGGREGQEDARATFKSPFGKVAVVADGMGGYRGGRWASRRTVLGLRHYLGKAGEKLAGEKARPKTILTRVIRAVSRDVNRKRGAKNLEKAGSTVVAALHRRDGVYIGHVGDSRAYLIRGDKIVRRTKDHSLVQQMVDAKLISPSEARVHKMRNVISQSVGQDKPVKVSVSRFRPRKGDRLLLLSDGLNSLPEQRIIEIATGKGTAKERASALTREAVAAGGKGQDNTTVELIDY
jgi:protein phosphatase